MPLRSALRYRSVPLGACLAFGLATTTARADVLTVGLDPETSDFTSIQSAVNAASDGDTILVGPGDYFGFQVAGKPLTILGAGSDLTRLTETFVPIFGPSGSIRISQVNEGRVRVGGFTVTPQNQVISPSVNRWVLAEFCNAPVELFDIQVPAPDATYISHDTGSAGPFWESGIFAAIQCRQLMLSDVSVTGYADQLYDDPVAVGAIWNTTEGYAGLSLDNTSAWVSNSHFEGCTAPACGTEAMPFAPVIAGAGARLWNSRLVATNCHFEGARGYAAIDGNCIDLGGGVGIDMKFASQAQLLGGPDAAVLGGDSFSTAPGGSGIAVVGPASLLYVEDSAPVGGEDDQGVPSVGIAEVASDSIQVTSSNDVRPALTASDNFLQQGEAFQIDLYGNPNGVQVVLWQAELSGQLASPLLVGDLFLNPASDPMLGVFALDAQGRASSALQVPFGNEFVGLSIAMQTTELIHPLFYPAPPIFLATRP